MSMVSVLIQGRKKNRQDRIFVVHRLLIKTGRKHTEKLLKTPLKRNLLQRNRF